MLGVFHTLCGVLALLLGVQIFLSKKGTRTHVRVGWGYVASMLCLNLSSFGIYNLTGGFNVFHALAAISLATVTVGVIQVVRRHRWRNWLWRHYQYMSWSYVGLLAATCNEAFVRIPPLKQLAAGTGASLPLIAMTFILLLSAVVIFLMQRRVLARYEG